METNTISIQSAKVEHSCITPRQNGMPSCRKGTFY